MPLSDAQAKAALRTWALVTRVWSGGEYIFWLRAQPNDVDDTQRSPRLTAAGSREFQTQPDGLWITLGGMGSQPVGTSTFADCVVVEVCGTAQNLNDKRSRYSARTSALVIEMMQPWLDHEVPRQGGAVRMRRQLLASELPASGVVRRPVRHVRVLYALDDTGARSLYARATREIVLEAHEYMLPQRILQQWTAPEMQEFLKRMAPRRQYR